MTASPQEPDDDRIPGLATAFGEILRKHRRALKLSQEELAIQTGLDRTFISLMERGLRKPSLVTVFVLAKRFGVLPSLLVRELESYLSSSHYRAIDDCEDGAIKHGLHPGR